MERYLFDQGWVAERQRLDALAAEQDPGTFERLRRVGVRPGARCLEVGAGSGTVARWMAAEVGGGGRVVATDLDARFLQGLDGLGVEVRTHDIAADPLEEGAFDVIHTRAVLQHVPAREVALGRMVAALAPHGRLLVEDIIMPHPASHPPLPAWGRFIAAMEAGLRGAGADPYYGLHLPAALTALGLVDLDCDARTMVIRSATPGAAFYQLSLAEMGPRMVAAGALAQRDVDEVMAALAAPGFTVGSATMIAAWGSARG